MLKDVTVDFLLVMVTCFIIITATASKEIYVSTDGFDQLGCGTPKSPCKELQYSLDKVAHDGDIILLLRGNQSKDYIFEFDKTVTISQKNLVIKTLGETRYNIKAADSLETLFDIKKNNSKIRLIGITSTNTTFFNINDKTITVDLVRCKINNSQKPIITFAETNDISSTKLTITESFINVTGFIIDHTNYNNDKLSLHIKDSQITGCTLISSTASSPFDMMLHNVIFKGSTICRRSTNEAVKLIQIAASYTSPIKSNLLLHNITITGNFSEKTDFLHCSFCNLNVTLIIFHKAQIHTAFTIRHSRGTIHKLHFNSTIASYGFMNITQQSDLVIGELVGDNITTKAPVVEVTVKSTVKIKKTRLTDSPCLRGQLFKVWKDSTVTVESVEVIGCNFTKVEALRIASNGVIEMHYFHMKDTACNQVIHASWLGTNYKSTGKIVIHSAFIVNNTVEVNIVGVQNTDLFNLTNAVVKQNRAINILVTLKSKATFYKNLTITENTMDKCFEIKQSNLAIDNVDIYNNKIIGYGKALYYVETSDCKTNSNNFTIIIQNFRAVIVNHARYDPKEPVLSIDITNSTLSLENVVVDISDMTYFQVKGVYLRFKTRNDRVHSALKVVCPRNYNPSNTENLGTDMFTYTIDCIPCSRDFYSAERGSDDILYIDNKNLDVKNWNNSRVYLHRSPPIIWECKACPNGGICTGYSIKGLGNYYGIWMKEEKSISFIPCPNSYCCSDFGQACVNYTGCNYNRRGTLCGTCDYGYYESYFFTKCISKIKCTVGNQERFWTIFIVAALILTIVLCFIKDFVIICMCFLNNLGLKMSMFVRRLTKNANSLQPTEEKIDLSRFVYNDQVFINSCIVQPEETANRKIFFSTILQIVISFFQIASLISVQGSKMKSTTLTRIVDFFNLQIAVKEAEELCPSPHFSVIWKHFTNNVLFVVTMLLFLVLATPLSCIYRYVKSRYCKNCSISLNLNVVQELKKASLIDRLVMCFIKILMIGYKNISLFTIICLHCVKIEETSVLFISGEVQCYQKWQWAVTALFVAWVIPFPAALVMSYRLFTRGSINEAHFIACLIFPPLIIYILIRNWHSKSICLVKLDGLKALLYNIFEEPYRVTSQHECSKETMYWWTAWLLYERLIIVMIVTFISEPLIRMCVVAPVIVCLMVLHYIARPYKKSMTLLSWLDISVFACLSFWMVESMFRSFLFTFYIRVNYPVNIAFDILEILKVKSTTIC